MTGDSLALNRRNVIHSCFANLIDFIKKNVSNTPAVRTPTVGHGNSHRAALSFSQNISLGGV